MLNKKYQTGLWHMRECAKLTCSIELRDRTIDLMPTDRPLIFYEGMIEACMQQAQMTTQIHNGAPAKDRLADIERYNLAMLWALADLWEKKVGRKLFVLPSALGHG